MSITDITHVLSYIITYSMEHSPSWEANRFAASQEIPRILWNPKVHYRIHKRPRPASTLSKLNPVQTLESYFSYRHCKTKVLKTGLRKEQTREERSFQRDEFQYPYIWTPINNCVNSKIYKYVTHAAGMFEKRNQHETWDGVNRPVNKTLLWMWENSNISFLKICFLLL
jgi:hypothetical protein